MLDFLGRLANRPIRILPDDETSGRIEKALGRPFFTGRLGWLESTLLETLSASRTIPEGLLARLRSNAGVFPPTEEQAREFGEIYFDALGEVDLLAVMNTLHERRLLRRLRPRLPYCGLAPLEPYLQEMPWSRALRGRRVLVVHPFADSIRAQYSENRSNLFSNPEILPQFELDVLSPPQTVGENTEGFSSWTCALAKLQERVLSHDFDVALIGCGAYGFPLGAAVKRAGRTAIHIGGALQNLFGISGKRWRDQPRFHALMNEYWRPPQEAERPRGWEKIENGCYW